MKLKVLVNDGLDKEGMKLFDAAGIDADCNRRDGKGTSHTGERV